MKKAMLCGAVAALATAAVVVSCDTGGATLSSVGHWSTTLLPAPPGAAAPQNSSVSSISCPTIQTCVTVGGATLKGGSVPGIVHSKVASGWTSQVLALPADVTSYDRSVTLRALSCAGAFCVAVGNYPTAGGNRKAVIYERIAGSWRRAAIALPSDASTAYPDSDLESVTCLSASRCVAVGNYQSTVGQPGLAVTFNGTHWVPTRLPVPSAANAGDPTIVVDAVACPSALSCVTVGDYYGTDHGYHPLAIALAGSHWSVATLPIPPSVPYGGSVVLNAVSCSAVTMCVAGGSILGAGTSSPTIPLIETRTGATWSPSLPPQPPNAAPLYGQTVINDMSCPTASLCVAGGSFEDGNANRFPALWSKVAGIWHADTLVVPVNSYGSSIESVTCLSATTCAIAGNDQVNQNASFAFVSSLTAVTAISGSLLVAANHHTTDSVGAAALGPLHVALVAQATHGTVSLSPNGTFVYTPKQGFVGLDSFRFTAIAGGQSAPVGTETLVVHPYKVPTASPITSSGYENRTDEFSLTGHGAGFGPLTFHVASQPANGSVSITAAGVVLYTPAASFTGSDSFTFVARDQFGGQSKPVTATVTIS